MTASDESPRVVLLDRRMAVSNRVWTVVLDHIRDQGGAEVCDYVTLIPKIRRPGLVTGVGILPVIGDEVLLLNNWRHPVERELLEIPRGFIDEGETPVAAALRELEEETGLICDVDDLHPLGLFYPEASTISGCGALFAAVGCRLGGRRLEDEVGLGSLRHIPLVEIFAMLDAFIIEEAGTALALSRYRSLRQRG